MDNRFELTVTLLLEQKVICENIYPEPYRFLLKESNQEEINAYLHKIGRSTARTNDLKGFYCIFSSLDDKRKRQYAQKQFETVIVNIEGLVEWLRMIRNIDKDSRPLEAGSRLNESELLAAIEESSTLSLLLENIAHKLKKGGKSSEVKTKLGNVLQYLTENQYLQPIGKSGSVFVATAKWSLLYDQLDFIRSHEGYAEEVFEEEADANVEQGSLI
jgi:hypothetical protein